MRCFVLASHDVGISFDSKIVQILRSETESKQFCVSASEICAKHSHHITTSATMTMSLPCNVLFACARLLEPFDHLPRTWTWPFCFELGVCRAYGRGLFARVLDSDHITTRMPPHDNVATM